MDIKPGHFLYRLVFLTFSISLTYPKHFTKGHHGNASYRFPGLPLKFQGHYWGKLVFNIYLSKRGVMGASSSVLPENG